MLLMLVIIINTFTPRTTRVGLGLQSPPSTRLWFAVYLLPRRKRSTPVERGNVWWSPHHLPKVVAEGGSRSWKQSTSPQNVMTFLVGPEVSAKTKKRWDSLRFVCRPFFQAVSLSTPSMINCKGVCTGVRILVVLTMCRCYNLSNTHTVHSRLRWSKKDRRRGTLRPSPFRMGERRNGLGKMTAKSNLLRELGPKGSSEEGMDFRRLGTTIANYPSPKEV